MVIHPKSVAVLHFISSGTGPRGSYWTSTSEHHTDTSLLCRQRDQSLFDNLPRKRTPTLAARLHLRIARYSFERSTIQSRVTARFPRLKKSSRVSSYATTPYAYASAPAWGIRRVEWTFVEDGQSPGVLIRYSFSFFFGPESDAWKRFRISSGIVGALRWMESTVLFPSRRPHVPADNVHLSSKRQ